MGRAGEKGDKSGRQSQKRDNTLVAYPFSPDKLSRIGHSEGESRARQLRTNRTKDSRIKSSRRIFPSMSVIFSSVRLSTSARAVRDDMFIANNSRISLSENPNPWARFINFSRPVVYGGKYR